MSKASIRERAREELVSYAAVSGYLFVCFAAFLFYKSALLRAEGVGFLPHGLAAVKALVLGKFILIGEAVGVGTRVRVPTLWQAVAVKSVLFFLLLVVLTFVEETLVGLGHGRSIARTLAEFEQQSVLELLARCLLMLLALIPLIAFKELNRALGPGTLRRLLVDPAAGSGDG